MMIFFIAIDPVELNPSNFWYFWLTVQNTANWHVSNAFGLSAVFISFPLVRGRSWLLGKA
jgi:hypothetical protein